MSETIRVLYIDDEPDLRHIVELALGMSSGMEVRSCANGWDGLAVAEEWRPALILLDMMMPELDGLGTLRLLREKPATSAIPVVFVTAMVRAEDRQRIEQAGALAIISKPFEVTRLAPLVRSLLAGAGARPDAVP